MPWVGPSINLSLLRDGMYHVARVGYVIFVRDILNEVRTVECGPNFSAESSTAGQAPVLLAHPVWERPGPLFCISA